MGPDFKPGGAGSLGPAVKPTFPAYSTSATISAAPTTISASATISAAPTIKKPESSSGLTIKLIHPDEDISLEEKRASLPKYRHMMGGGHHGGNHHGNPGMSQASMMAMTMSMQGSMGGQRMGMQSQAGMGMGYGHGGPPGRGGPPMIRPLMQQQGRY